MRLIDADAKELNQRITINFGAVTRLIVKSILKDAPTIDAVPVVRCRECEHYIEGKQVSVCRHEKGMVEVMPDDFCSYGERRDEDV